MPSHAIDLIIWDSTADGEVIASAVSPAGSVFLQQLTNEEEVSSIVMILSPEEFAQQIPPGLEVAFNRGDGCLVKIDCIRGLQ